MPSVNTADRLSAQEAAERLGVTVRTLYAYVSRGMLQSERSSDHRLSLFDPAEVERLARRPSRRMRPHRTTAGPGASDLTRIEGTSLSYRGQDACELARSHQFEAVAHWLWTGRWDGIVHWSASEHVIAAAQQSQKVLPEGALVGDRLLMIVPAAALNDPLRLDTSEAAVVSTARSLLTTMVEALPVMDAAPVNYSIAARLWARLAPAPPAQDLLEVLNAALILVADHGPRPPATVAATLAASAGSDPYAVVMAALSVGSGAQQARPFLSWQKVFQEIDGPDHGLRVIGDRLRRGDRIPGFQPRQYTGADPRAHLLLRMLGERLLDSRRLQGITALIHLMHERRGVEPNVEVAIAALSAVADMCPDAGEAIFSVARSVGWIAHALRAYAAGTQTGTPRFLQA
jgi:citrate synthase